MVHLKHDVKTGLVQKIQDSLGEAFDTHRILFHARIEVQDHVVKKNHKSIRYRYTKNGFKPYIGGTDTQINAESFLVLELQRRASLVNFTEPINTPVHAMLLFFYPKERFFTVKGTGKRKPQTVRRSGKLPDLSNLYELPQDALQKAGIITDDKLIRAHDGSRILPGEKCELEIFLLQYDESKELARWNSKKS